MYGTTDCGCAIEVEIGGGCQLWHSEGDYCECPSEYIEWARIITPCAEHAPTHLSIVED